MEIDGKAPVLRAALVCLALAGATATADAQQDRQGYYAGIEMGALVGSPLGSNMRAVSHPTRCDRLLYHGSVAYPAGDPACTHNTSRDFLANQFDTGGGFAGGLVLGYEANVFRFEVEYLRRLHGNDTAPAGSAGNVVLSGKDTEWSNEQPPSESIRDYNAHQIFFNAYYDFLNDSPWTPYAGADYALTEKTSIGATLRRARFEGFEDEATWNLVRSHAPVIADGVTPFDSRLKFEDIGYQAVTVNLKYRF